MVYQYSCFVVWLYNVWIINIKPGYHTLFKRFGGHLSCICSLSLFKLFCCKVNCFSSGYFWVCFSSAGYARGSESFVMC